MVVLRLWEDHSRSSARETMAAMFGDNLGGDVGDNVLVGEE